ncbi:MULTISPECIES: GntR family transcriptional regulator [unclassified Clostridium]|uniref:GntR family transcriptional regulator n=1 Tax=unclassified Clostridium TaxID=2614128 RepID=UPI00052CEE7F|nr:MULTISPECIES: GntR family transcriptional regulator [unclassified Clostridium]KGK87663.1 GntR family transcriptional regulator [Clostridium sp. HMP27]
MNIIISNTSGEPIYEQIVKQIKKLIFIGELNEGDPLPSIRNLAQELRISVITTKRAYEELENEGYIVTMQGKGSFVASQNKELLKEKRLRLIEEKLGEAVKESRLISLSLEELIDILSILYNETYQID